MENVRVYIRKLRELAQTEGPLTAIETDLMLEHTRRLYDALLDMRRDDKENVTDHTGTQTISAPQTIVPGTEAEETYTLTAEETQPETTDTEELQASPLQPFQELPPVAEPLSPEQDTDQPEQITNEIPLDINTAEAIAPPQVVTAQSEPAPQQPLFLAELLEHKHTRPAAGQDIRSYISIADKYQCINELFGNNAEAYEEILDELNNQEVVEDAYMFLTNSGVTTLYKWDNDSEAVHMFYDTLTRFFSVR